MISDIIAGLEELHTLKIFHRDLIALRSADDRLEDSGGQQRSFIEIERELRRVDEDSAIVNRV